MRGPSGPLERREPADELLEVDCRLRLRVRRVPAGPVVAEVIRVVLDHPLELVLVKPRVPGAAAAALSPAVLLPAPVRAGAPELLRPRWHQFASSKIIRSSSLLTASPRKPRPPTARNERLIPRNPPFGGWSR